MDWSNVTAEELFNALKEADWASPRPLWEFLTSLSLPKNQVKWTSRLKCNAYYYRTNYLAMLGLCALGTLFRQPRALLGVGLLIASAMCLNDPFVAALNDVVIKGVRRVNSKAASLLRSLCRTGHSDLSTSVRKGKPRVLGLQRHAAMALMGVYGLYSLWRGLALVPLLLFVSLGLGLPLLHATVRSPNLKARLASAREEFRAVWRGYQADMTQQTQRYNYTL